jgi:CheY-like chemotaxis protein
MSHKLLLADDSVTIQRVIELTFADEDVQLTCVGDGAQAIERIAADPPDIVLADVGMPEKDGYDVAGFIKNDPKLRHIPVLLLTGAFEPIDEERARAVGCDGVLAKPFEPQMVITRVKELLAEASRPPVAARAIPPSAVPAAAPAPVPVEEPAPQPRTVTMSREEMQEQIDALTQPMTASAVEAPVPDEVAAAPAAAPPAGEETIVLESALDAAVRIRRRSTMPVPEVGVPPADQPPAPQAALDEYFERLDAAFATLKSPETAPAADAWPAAVPATPAEAPVPVVPAAPAAPLAGLDEPVTEAMAAFQPPPMPAPFEEVTVAMDAPAPPAPPPVAAPPPAAEVPPPVFAQAFSALLAAERGEGDELPAVPFFGAAAAPAPIDEDALVERVTRADLEQMSDRVVRETVTDVVSRVAERLVREEIARIKASIP